MFYINIVTLMCKRKKQMNRCSAGSFERLTGHVVPIAAVGVVLG